MLMASRCCIADILEKAEIGSPFDGAKPHYILNIEDKELTMRVMEILKRVIPLSESGKKK